MAFLPGHTPSHTGKTTTTDPIKTMDDLSKVKVLVQDDVRLHALWAVATNSALRASDLVSLTWSDAHDDGSAVTLIVKERKTYKRRVVTLNTATSKALRAWRDECAFDHIFSGQRGAMTVGSWGRIVKDLCSRAGLDGRHCSHTCRKTWVRLQLDEFGTSLSTLMFALNHSTERQTLAYAGRLGDDVAAAYSNSL